MLEQTMITEKRLTYETFEKLKWEFSQIAYALRLNETAHPNLYVRGYYEKAGLTVQVWHKAAQNGSARRAVVYPEAGVEAYAVLKDEELARISEAVTVALRDTHFKCGKGYVREDRIEYYIRPDWDYWYALDGQPKGETMKATVLEVSDFKTQIEKSLEGRDLAPENGKLIHELVTTESSRLMRSDGLGRKDSLWLAAELVGKSMNPPQPKEAVMSARMRYINSFPNKGRFTKGEKKAEAQVVTLPGKNGKVEAPAKANEWTLAAHPVASATILGRAEASERVEKRAFTELVADVIASKVVLVGETVGLTFLDESTARRATKAMNAILRLAKWKDALPPVRQGEVVYVTRTR